MLTFSEEIIPLKNFFGYGFDWDKITADLLKEIEKPLFSARVIGDRYGCVTVPIHPPIVKGGA